MLPPQAHPAAGAHSSGQALLVSGNTERMESWRLKQNKFLQTPAKNALLPKASASSGSIWPGRGRTARHGETRRPPEKSVIRSALSKNRVFSGHRTERRRPKNAVDLISKMGKWPGSVWLLACPVSRLLCSPSEPLHPAAQPGSRPFLPCIKRSVAVEREGEDPSGHRMPTQGITGLGECTVAPG